MAKRLEIPLTLETCASLRGALKDALARSDYGIIYANAVLRLINSTCARIVSDPPDNLSQILADIGYACDIALALNNSIGESLLPITNLAASFEQREASDE